ncbi:MAG: dTDP-4-dehydrorhamnose 3,5-epimerase family protein [Lentisphaerota bacterium]
MSTSRKDIEGVAVRPLRKIPDERGLILHMLKSSDPHFTQFGEIYFSVVYPQVIKGWHIHDRMTLNYAVVAGMIKLVLYDDREGSPTRGNLMEIVTGEDNYALITVPPMVWNGFKGIGVKPAMVANCSDIAHDPNEIHRLDPFDQQIPYKWDLVHR